MPIMEELAAVIAGRMKSALNPVYDRLHAVDVAQAQRDADLRSLQVRLAELESKPLLKWTGTWAPDKAYAPGDCATRGGGLWTCRQATIGDWDHTCWQLSVKKGAAR